MQEEELVSVIMPTYNAGKYLASSIRSILTQTYGNLELLITDDASSDPETLEILRRFEQKDPRVDVLFLTSNQGPGYARNKSIERAKGRYIAFCDSDDQWVSDKLERQIAFMKEKHCALTCTSYVLYDAKLQQAVGINVAPAKITFDMMKRDNKIGCLTALYDTHLLGKKYYMPTLRKRQDWGYFIEIIRDCKVCYAYTDKPLAFYCIRNNSISRNKIWLAKYNIAVYQEILGFGWLKSHLYFALIFLPTYGIKLLKRKMDSLRFLNNQTMKKHSDIIKHDISAL